jgi:hypothetical protein
VLATISYAANTISWEGNVKLVDPSQVGSFLAKNAFYPAMAVFMEGKPVHSHAGVINKLQEWWKAAVQIADKIGIAGVHPNPADKHIWEPLAATSAELIIIGDQKAYESWHQRYRPNKKMDIVGNRFDPALEKFAEKFSA